MKAIVSPKCMYKGSITLATNYKGHPAILAIPSTTIPRMTFETHMHAAGPQYCCLVSRDTKSAPGPGDVPYVTKVICLQ